MAERSTLGVSEEEGVREGGCEEERREEGAVGGGWELEEVAA